jgi:lambda repressor-like predicted transcriptional regulator
MRLLAFDERAFRVALAAAGFRSVAALARSANLSTSYLRQVGRGFIPSPAVRTVLAAQLEVDELELWPPVAEQAPRLKELH